MRTPGPHLKLLRGKGVPSTCDWRQGPRKEKAVMGAVVSAKHATHDRAISQDALSEEQQER